MANHEMTRHEFAWHDSCCIAHSVSIIPTVEMDMDMDMEMDYGDGVMEME